MLKNFRTLLRNGLTGVIWFAIFTTFSNILLYLKWGFDLTSARHWRYLQYIWNHGWHIDTVREWAFILYLLAFVPIFIAGWVLWVQLDLLSSVEQYLKTVYAFVKKHIIKPIEEEVEELLGLDDEPKKIEPGMPREIFEKKKIAEAKPYFPEAMVKEMEEGVKKESSGETKEEKQTQSANKPVVSAQPVSTPKPSVEIERPAAAGIPRKPTLEEESSIDDILSRLQSHEQKSKHAQAAKAKENKKEVNNQNKNQGEKKNNQNQPKKNNIENKEQKPIPEKEVKFGKNFKEKGYVLFETEVLKKHNIDLLAISEEKAVLVKTINQNASWMADEEKIDGHAPVWMSDNGTMQSPAYDLVEARKELKKKFDKEIEFEGIVLIENGQIANVDDVKSTWRRNNIQAINVNKEGKTSFLKHLGDYLSEEVQPLSKQEVKKIKEQLSENV